MSSFELDQLFLTLGLKFAEIRCNNSDNNNANKENKEKIIYKSRYFKHFDLEGDRN